MKFENIKTGMKIQHKENGKVFIVGNKGLNGLFFYLDDFYLLPNQNMSGTVSIKTCKLFRKYKGEVK